MPTAFLLLIFWCAPAFACSEGARLYPLCGDAVARFEADLKTTAESNQLLLVTFGADWCPWCRSLHQLLEGPVGKGYAVRHVALFQERDKLPAGVAVLDRVKRLAGVKAEQKGIPVLALVNGRKGKAVIIDTEVLESNTAVTKGHDTQKLRAALSAAEKRLR